MLGRRRILLLNKGNFENSKVSKCKRRHFRPRNIKNIFRNTSHGNGRSANLNPSYAETSVSDDSRFQEEHLHEMKDNQLEFDASRFSEDERWTRTVRSMEKDLFCEASTCNSATNIECWSSNAESNNREKLRSTDTWRKLLLPQADVGYLLISEEIFKENVKALLDGMDSIEDKPSHWSRIDSHFYFNKIKSFMDNWSRQLLIEKERLDEEVWQAKEKLKVKYDLVTNRLSLLTGVFGDLVAPMKFSEFQKHALQTKTEELGILNTKLIDCEECNLGLQEASFVNQLKEKDRELSESRKKVDEYREELSQAQNKLKATEAELNKLMYSNNQQLNECRNQADEFCKELSQMQNKLKATEAELNNLKYTNNQKAQLEQKEMQVKLFEIRSMLVKKSDSNNRNGRYFNTDLNKENVQILKDIKSLIQYEMQLVEDEEIEVIEDENMQETDNDSGILKVTENEMHLVTLIASFLKVTPFPVSTEFIYSYVAKIDNVVDLQYVERMLNKFPTFFKEVLIAPGSTKKNWCYLDLKPIITI